MNRCLKIISLSAVFILASVMHLYAQEDEAENETEQTSEEQPEIPQPIIRDVNGNGTIDIIAFGDSITRGVGDFTETGEEILVPSYPEREAGYPLRVERFLNVKVQNRGVPGEVLNTMGLKRFATLIPSERPDFVIFSGGTNDALKATSNSDFSRSVQTMINIANAVGTVPMIATITPVCCNHEGSKPFILLYNRILYSLANTNNIEIADIARAYKNTCQGEEKCYLLNLPEGEHPNTAGYDVSGEVVSAKLLNIDLFAPNGATLFSQATGVPISSIRTLPDPVVTTAARESN